MYAVCLSTLTMAEEDVITQVPSVDERSELAAVAELPETITLKMRGQKFVVKRDRLLTLPESVLFSLSNSMAAPPPEEAEEDPDTMSVDFDPTCFKYIIDALDSASVGVNPVPITEFTAARPQEEGHSVASEYNYEDDESVESVQWLPHAPNEVPYVLESRPTLIVLREDLEYYVVRDPRQSTEDDIEVKELVGEAMQNGADERFLFNGLKNAQVLDSPEYHLMQMLVLSGIDPKKKWHYRKRIEYSSHLLSLQMSLVKLPESPQMLEVIYSLQKLLLFWRKPAKKCWWDRFEMTVGPTKHKSEPEKVRVHVRRVWTLELSIIGLEE